MLYRTPRYDNKRVPRTDQAAQFNPIGSEKLEPVLEQPQAATVEEHYDELEKRVMSAQSVYTRALELSKNLEPYISDENERLKITFKMILGGNPRVDFEASINAHVADLTEYRNLLMTVENNLGPVQKIDESKRAINELTEDIEASRVEIASLQKKISVLEQSIGNRQAMIENHQEAIEKATQELNTPFNQAVNQHVEKLTAHKNLLSEVFSS